MAADSENATNSLRLHTLVQLIDDLVNYPAPYTEKRKIVVEKAEAMGLRTSLEEFAAWFEPEE